MKPTIIEIIKQKVDRAKDIPTSKIEYNFKLPKVKGIKPDSFFGIPAIFNPNMRKIQLI